MDINFPNFIVYAIPFFFLLIGVELLYGLFKKKKLYRINDSIADLGTGVLSRFSGIFLAGFTILVYIFLYENFRFIDWPMATAGGMTLSFIVAFVAYDFVYYWVHRWSHEMNFLWAGHVVHHQSEEYNLAVALRQPAFHSLFTWWIYLPLALIGFHPVLFIAVGQLNLIYQFWIHTRAFPDLGFLETFLNTPSHHRVHHGKNPHYIDKNHGGTFIIFDKMFGTFQKEDVEPVYGTVKPFKSFNPLWANLHYWKEIWDMAVAAPHWKDKIRVWFKHPGWLPEGLGEMQPIPEVSADQYQKFDVKIPSVLSFYSLLWFAIITVIVFAMLQMMEQVSLLQVAGIAGLGTMTLVVLGTLLEGRKYAPVAEVFRLLVCAAYALVAAYYPAVMGPLSPSFPMAAGFVAFCLLSMIPVFKYRPQFRFTRKDYESEIMNLDLHQTA